MNILLRLATVVLLFSAPVCRAAEEAVGRWEGSIQIPGREFPVIVDLEQNGGKDWAGSIIIPGLGVKGTPLTDLAIKGSEISFTIKGALGSERVGLARFQGNLGEGGVWSGTFLQAGNSAPFTMRRSGRPQVELPRGNTAISKELEGEWKGDYEMGGYPRHVTLTLANQASGPATAELIIVGKRTNHAPIDLLIEEDGLLTIESHEFGITYESRRRTNTGELKGTFTLGPLEVPLSLKRAR